MKIYYEINIRASLIVGIMCLIQSLTGSQPKAQGVHFSQYYSSPLVLNPAYTGQHDDKFRIVSNTSIQGSYFDESVVSGTISYDQQIVISRAEIGVGACYTYDRSLASNFPVQSFNLSLASALSLSEKSGIGLGIQVGYNHMNFKYDHLSFPEQYNRLTGHFDPNLPITENFDNSSANYLNVNTGLVWNYALAKSHINAGVSVRHLNSPSFNLSDINSNIKPRFIYHLVYKNYKNQKLHITPRILFTHQNSNSYMSLGSNVQINKDFGLENAKGLVFGIYYAFREEIDASSLIGLVGFEKRMFTVLLSGEFNINQKLGNVHNQAFEITFILKRPSLVLKKTIVPWISH